MRAEKFVGSGVRRGGVPDPIFHSHGTIRQIVNHAFVRPVSIGQRRERYDKRDLKK